MSNDRPKEVLTLYLERWGHSYPPKRMDTEGFFGDRQTVMAHVMWMCSTALKELEENNDRDKANRWLGFIQGVLFCVGHYTIDEMRAHTSDPTEP